MKKLSLSLVLVIILLFACVSAAAYGEQQAPEVNWTQGPASIDIENMAKIDMPAAYLYANKADTTKLMEYFGNTENDTTIGSIFSQNEEENWFIIFEHYDIGHIKDSEKDKIDADELLKSYKEGTEEENKRRRKEGIPEMTLKGWIEPPKYDSQLHSLVWCLLAESSDGNTINYEARLLCREGYVAATLVCSDAELETAKPHFNEIIQKFSFNEGKRYEDYVAGKDKLSDLGLTALVVGGTAVAVKKGLIVAIIIFMKKGGIILIAAVGAFLGKVLGKPFKRKKADTGCSETYNTSYQTAASAEEPVECVNLQDNSAFNTSPEQENNGEERPMVWIGLNEVQNEKPNGVNDEDIIGKDDNNKNSIGEDDNEINDNGKDDNAIDDNTII